MTHVLVKRFCSTVFILCGCYSALADGPKTSTRPGCPATSTSPGVTAHPRPNDPYFKKQYYFQTMQVLEAWAITKGSPDCLIGVIEQDLDHEHPDFRENLLPGYKAEGMEYGGFRERNHGTSVVGLLVARANNGIGVAGLAPDCKVVPAVYGTHALFREGTPESSRKWNKLAGEKTAEALRYLVDRGCKVINCSYTAFGTPRATFEYAIQHDVVLVFAAGNLNYDKPMWPAGVLDVLSVGGVDKKDNRWVGEPRQVNPETKITEGSSYGDGLSVMAPVLDLVLCMPQDKRIDANLRDRQWKPMNFGGKAVRGYLWCEETGTSCTAPMATALVALIRSLRPDLDYKSVIRIVEQGADDLGPPGWDKFTGYGRLNFYKSLKLAQSWPRRPSENQR